MTSVDPGVYLNMREFEPTRRYFMTQYPASVMLRLLNQGTGPRRAALSTHKQETSVHYRWLKAKDMPSQEDELRGMFMSIGHFLLSRPKRHVPQEIIDLFRPLFEFDGILNVEKQHAALEPYFGFTESGVGASSSSSSGLPYACTLHLNHIVTQAPILVTHFLPASSTSTIKRIEEGEEGDGDAMERDYYYKNKIEEEEEDSCTEDMDVVIPTSEKKLQWQVVTTERELVFDLDLRDWETARPKSRSLLCNCDDKSSCRACWLLLEMAAAAFQCWLGKQCHYGPMLFVFSGGKGAHFHFGNKAARTLSTKQRETLVSLIVNAPEHMHAPHFAQVRAHLLRTWIQRGIEERALLDDPHLKSPLANYLLSQLNAIPFRWPPEAQRLTTPQERSLKRWQALEAALSPDQLTRFLWHLGWPVLDVGVVTTRSHLVKAPFSIHATSWRIALPLSERMIRDCHPATMPKASQLTTSQLQEATQTLVQWMDDCGTYG